MKPLARVRSKTGRSPTQAGEGRAVNRRAMAAPCCFRDDRGRGHPGADSEIDPPRTVLEDRVVDGSHPGTSTPTAVRRSPLETSRSSPHAIGADVARLMTRGDRRDLIVHTRSAIRRRTLRSWPCIAADRDPATMQSTSTRLSRARSRGGGQGEPGGTRAMGACEPGQGGNAAAISIAFMCPGEPPRLSPPPAARAVGSADVLDRADRPSRPQGPTERASWPDPEGRTRRRPSPMPRRATPSSPAATGRSGSRTSSGRTTSSRRSATRSG